MVTQALPMELYALEISYQVDSSACFLYFKE